MRMLPRVGNIYSANGMPAVLDHFLEVGRDVANMIAIQFVRGHQNIQLIKIWLLTQLRQSVQSDVSIHDILHPGLGLAHVADAAADAERSLFSPRRLNGHCVANPRPRDLERVSFDQYFPRFRRPGALLWLKRADADVS